MDAGFIARRLVEKFNSVSECEVGIIGAELGRGNALFAAADDDGGGAGFLSVGTVAAIREESQMAGLRVFNASNAGNVDIRIAIEIALQARGNFSKQIGRAHV